MRIDEITKEMIVHRKENQVLELNSRTFPY